MRVKEINLIIAAHPDDEVIGCGGTIARLVKEDHPVYIAILGEGITSRYRSRERADKSRIESLRTTSQRAALLLGVKDVFMFDLPDNRFDTVPMLDIVKLIEGLIDQVDPQVIYTHHNGDLNIDHRITFQATLTATRPVRGCGIKSVYSYEVASSTEWAFGKFSAYFQPNIFIDIHKTLEQKLQAMDLYESERRIFPHPRSAEALRASAVRWGSVVGFDAAEAFELIRELR